MAKRMRSPDLPPEAAGTGVEAAAGSLLLLNVTSKRLPLAETW